MDKRKGKKTTARTSKAKPVKKKTKVVTKKKMGSSKTKTGTNKGTGAVKKTTVTKKSLVGIKKGVIKSIKNLAGGKRSSKVDKFMGEMLNKKINMQNRLKYKTTFISLTSKQKSELERKVKQSPVKQRMMLKNILKEIT